MFVGRSNLVSLVEQLVLVDGRPPTGLTQEPPVLVIEGYGGTGRSAFLDTQAARWKPHTPTALVNARSAADADVDSLRPLLVAVMQGLSEKVGTYEVKFPRVVLAYVAMESPIEGDFDVKRSRDEMKARLVAYRDRDALIGLVGSVVQSSFGALVPQLGMGDAFVDGVAQRIVDRLRRASRLARFSWDEALPWFRHQDNGYDFDEFTALVRLSKQAAKDTSDVRADVDDLLMGAMLADLRESLDRVANRPWNAVVLLDEGDTAAARSFVTALVDRRRRRHGREPRLPPDPLVVVTTSAGALSQDLPDVDAGHPWLREVLGDLTEADVHDLARARLWPPDLGTRRVADVTHRLTGGHAEATVAVLDALEDDHGLIDRVDEIFDRPVKTSRKTLEAHLLDKVVTGMGAGDHVAEDLATLSAARSRGEATRLAKLLRLDPTLELMASPSLWPDQALPRFVRYLGLRRLAARTEGHRWTDVFTALRDEAVRQGDVVGSLHHRLALGETAAVAAELTGLLPELGDTEWLELLDSITATPALAHPLGTPKVDDPVHRLLVTSHALSDSRLSERAGLRSRYVVAEKDLRSLAGSSEAFVLRAQHYHKLAGRLD
ncbi:hypothetical protein AB0H12_20435 [Actinosynnema sp. NPDC023794]